MFEITTIYTLAIFSLLVMLFLWRPRGIYQSIPPIIGAILVFLVGIVPLSDISKIPGIVSGASITILSTIVMSIVLDSIGFFRWTALNIVNRANGSGVVLYWYINLLCFMMTMFFNNDGSILITTPIIINIVIMLKFEPNQQLPYLLSGALIAIASSAPIAVSNLANLIAMKIAGLDLNSYVALMFVPSMMGIIVISLLLFYYFREDIPQRIMVLPMSHIKAELIEFSSSYYNNAAEDGHSQASNLWPLPHLQHHQRPHLNPGKLDKAIQLPVIDLPMFKVCIAIVVMIRAGLFVSASINIPFEYIGMFGALLLMGYRWLRTGIGPNDIVKKTPWHIILLAFSIYVIVTGLNNIGFINILVDFFRGPIIANHLNACLILGGLLTLMSNLFNNLPSVMIGTSALTGMGLDNSTLHLVYLASIIGADIGSLITPLGTLASLIWMSILREKGIKVRWVDIVKVTVIVIPVGLLISLLSLYYWVEWLINNCKITG